MKTIDFLRDHLQVKATGDLEMLDALMGSALLPALGWFETVEASRSHCRPRTPIQFVPFATDGTSVFAVQLRREDLASSGLNIVEVSDSGAHMGVATSVRAFVYRVLALREYDIRKSGLDVKVVRDESASVNSVLGNQFYVVGRDEPKRLSELERVIADRVGSAPITYVNLARSSRRQPEDELRFLEEGRSRFPTWMYFHVELAARMRDQGKTDACASTFRNGLGCYHHTAGMDISYVHLLGKHLVSTNRALFNDDQFEEIVSWNDDAAAARRIDELAATGRFEDVEHSISNLSHYFGNYETAVPSFRIVYQKLAWDWAMELCNFRAGTR